MKIEKLMSILKQFNGFFEFIKRNLSAIASLIIAIIALCTLYEI